MKKVNKWEDQQMEDGVELTKFYFFIIKKSTRDKDEGKKEFRT